MGQASSPASQPASLRHLSSQPASQYESYQGKIKIAIHFSGGHFKLLPYPLEYATGTISRYAPCPLCPCSPPQPDKSLPIGIEPPRTCVGFSGTCITLTCRLAPRAPANQYVEKTRQIIQLLRRSCPLSYQHLKRGSLLGACRPPSRRRRSEQLLISLLTQNKTPITPFATSVGGRKVPQVSCHILSAGFFGTSISAGG